MKHLAWIVLSFTGLPVFGAGCEAAVGDWKWFNGGLVTFQANNVLLYDGKAGGKWECTNAAKGAVTLRWNAGFVDTMTLAGDKMSGKNQRGVAVSANRRPKPKPAH